MSVRSVCPYCGVGCGVLLETNKGRVVKVGGDPEHPANRGKLCTKGMNLHKTIHTPDRLTQPLMRESKDSFFIPASWDASLERISKTFLSLIDRYGVESIAFYISGQLLTEDYYVVNKLAKGFLKVNNVDSNSRLCMSSAVMGYRRSFGVDAPPTSYEDVDSADCIFIIGSNMAYCHPVIFMQVAEAKERKGGNLKIIVADPRKTPTAGIADAYLPINPGSDVALLNSMIHVLINEGLIDREFVSSCTEGFEELEKIVSEYPPDKVSELCGIPSSLIRESALLYGRAKSALSFWAMGLNQSSSGTDKNNALINLSLVTGNIGRPGAGPFSLTGQANAMGGRETGGLANLLPGHRYMDNPRHRQEVELVWGCDEISGERGLTSVELFDAVHKGIIKAVWIICTNPVVSLPNSSKFEEALKRAELVVVQELFSPTDTALFADILLPAAGFGEKEGTMTNSERRISHISKAVEPPGMALPDWEILTRFAHKIGFSEFFQYNSAEDVFEEYKRLTKGTDMDITGITYERLKTYGPIQWPCPNKDHPGTPRLYTDRKFHTETGKAQLIPLKFIPPAETTDSDFPFVLTTGRLRDQWHTMTKTGKVETLLLHDPSPMVEINPVDAERFSIGEGDLVVVQSRRGESTVQATVTERVKEGTIFMPFHWGKLLADNGRANLLTVEALDPFSKQPEFKACAVRIKKKTFAERFKVVIFGDDPISVSVAQNMISANPKVEIILIRSREFLDPALLEGVQVFRQSPVRIEPENRRMIMEDESIVTYDKLVLATGSKFYVPPISNLFYQGVLILDNFDKLKKSMAKLHLLRRAIVFGDGPSSLEAADLISSRGAEVEIVNPSTVLLEKHLDGIASELLFYELKKRGIKITLGADVETIIGNGRASGIQLENGKIIEADLIVVEARLRANVELASKSSILVNKGIIVGERLETSVPDVYAVGSAAEFRGNTTSDGEILSLQAKVLGRYLAGDPTVRYREVINCTRLRILGLDVLSFGEFNADDEESNVLSYLDQGQSVYKKIVVRDNRVVGGLFLGDTKGGDQILELARNRKDISALRHSLLSGSLKEKTTTGKVLCSCTGVTTEETQSAIRHGMGNLETLQKNLRVGVTCGTCLQDIRELLKATLRTN